MKDSTRSVLFRRKVRTPLFCALLSLSSCGGSHSGTPGTGPGAVESVSQKQINTTAPNAYCENPALLEGMIPPFAPGFIFFFKQGTNAVEEATRLVNVYEMEVGAIYDSLLGFYATMTDDVMERVRCEATIKSVHYNGVATNSNG